MKVDVRLAIALAVGLLTVGLGVAFGYAARAIRREHDIRFRRIQQRLERDAAALVDRLLRRG